ncbi:MAG TPA: DegT/DnrJ/EryC1/StrS family aminotransferase [Acidobacteriota bacterium]|nr:DegT/DnrJ/EryC1/StrS family aminotransferase [Acidobacteriota bacterium]
MAVPLLDLTRQYSYLKPELDRAVLDVLAHSRFILGPEVTHLESEIARLCKVDHGIGVASGTDALMIALRAAGVGPGDEVITTDFSFFSTASVIARVGATPVFVDIEPDTYNLDVTLIEQVVTDRTRAIIPVHLFGQPADMDAVMEVAARHDLKVIEDAAQAIGAEYKGRPAGSIGDFGCFSFYPTKNLGADGDAGMIVTKTPEHETLCRSLRAHGENPKYYHQFIGYNSRLDTMQAAVLLVKLPYLRQWSQIRREHARRYDEAFADVPDLVTPAVREYATFHIYNQYTLASTRRDQVVAALKKAGIGYCVYYPVAFHAQTCFASLGYKPDEFPVSSRAASEVFSLPIYPELTAEEQSEVIDAVRRALA